MEASPWWKRASNQPEAKHIITGRPSTLAVWCVKDALPLKGQMPLKEGDDLGKI